MKRKASIVLLTLLGLACVPAQNVLAQFNYGFLKSTGTRMTGSFTNLNFTHRTGTQWGSSFESRLLNIGFTFQFDGVNYTQLTVYHSGVIAMGNTSLSSPTGNALRTPGGPVIAPFWDDMRITDNLQWQSTGCAASSIRYFVSGSAPNRILVVDWDQLGLGQGGQGFRSAVSFQARLYESGGKIEFWYDDIDGTSDGCSQWGSGTLPSTASIGLASSNGFLSVTPNGSNASSSTSRPDDNVDVSGTPLSSGTLYTFCPAGLTGNVAQGGTSRMANGDTLLLGRQVVLSSSQNFNPFSLVSTCAPTFTYTITGSNASEYTITPSSGSLPSVGNTPTLRFAPTGIGRRYATLTVVDGANFVNRTFILAGEGIPRTTWIGNVAQGGTSGMGDGDTLMRNIAVYNGSVENFTPFRIEVAAGGNTPAPITYTLTDPTGQFTIDRTLENVMPGSNSMPVITFAPTLIGWQTATLVINAEGEVRSFVIRAFSRGAGALFSVNGETLGAGASVFRNVYACIGAEVQTVEILVESIGDEPFLIQTNDAYQTDNVIKQGTPPFELLRDPFGNLVPVVDYFISAAPGSKIPLQLPLAISPGTSQTVYLNFLPTRSGKRQARAFFKTNGLNFTGIDTARNPVRGMLNFELVGTGLGAAMTNAQGDNLPSALVFPPTEVRSTSRLTGYIRNDGDCDMTIPSADFRLVSGDVNEFAIVSDLSATKDADGNYVIPPGRTDSFAVDFTPTRSGSRRASIRVRSNDSSIVQLGIAELGVYYLDVYGVGKVGLEGRPVMLPPAVIDGPGSTGVATLENTASEVVEVTAFTLQSASGEIMEDPANPWPAPPIKLGPGEKLILGLAFVPTAGSAPGVRTATLEITLGNGAVLTIDVDGLAGTRQLAVAPTSLFQGMQVDVGDVRRQFVSVTNTGTFPVTVQQLDLTETNPGDYSVSALVRGVMEPGQIEFYEVTYSPQATGQSSGTLEIVTNSTNGPHSVMLGGEGTVIAPAGGGSGTNIAVTGEDAAAIRPGGISGWSAAMANGTLLWQSTPNPTGDRAEIRFYLPADEQVELKLFSANGELAQVLASGMSKSGENRIEVDVRSLASGRYYYTLKTAGGTLTLGLDVVK